MMRILFAYTSKHGTTRECARIFSEYIGNRATVECFDLAKAAPSLDDGYDAVVLGGSIRYGRASKALKRFIRDNIDALNSMPVAAFLCCGFPDEFDDYVSIEFKGGFQPSLGFHCFGGELKPKKVKGIERIIVKALRNTITQHDFEDTNYKGSLPEIMPDTIQRVADAIFKA